MGVPAPKYVPDATVPDGHEVWESFTFCLWGKDAVDGQGFWNEGETLATRQAVDTLGLLQTVEEAVNAALAKHPELARYRFVAQFTRNELDI